jgi:hypothetical protein
MERRGGRQGEGAVPPGGVKLPVAPVRSGWPVGGTAATARRAGATDLWYIALTIIRICM